MPESATQEQIFSMLADRHTRNILKMAYLGFKASSDSLYNLSKKQFYTRLRRLRDAGFVEKRDGLYKATAFGSLVYNGQVKTLEEILANYWNLKAVDVLKSRQDFPSDKKESVINEIIQSSSLKGIINATYLSSFSIIKDFNHLINEVIRLLDCAQKEIYFASRYFNEHVSKKLFGKVAEGVKLHLLDGLPEAFSIESRLNAVLRTPPNKEMFDLVNSIVKSSNFDLKRALVPASFMVVDGTMVGYEITSYANPQQFTVGLAHYDDPSLAERFITYFHLLTEGVPPAKVLANIHR